MSYLHCPRCQRAYNLAREPACPACGIHPGDHAERSEAGGGGRGRLVRRAERSEVKPGAPLDPVDDVIAAAEQLARAIERATPEQLAEAEHRSKLSSASGILQRLRGALAPAGPSPYQALLLTGAIALLARLPARAPPRSLAARAAAWSSRARALLARFA